MLTLPNHTPLIALPVLALDLETTGLDVRSDRVVQLAAIAMHSDKLLDSPRLDALVNPLIAIPPASSAIHGIVDADVAAAPEFAAIADQLKPLLSGRVVVGHNIGFDMAILRHEFARAGLVWHEPTVIDIGQLLGALRPSLPDLGLETVTSFLGVKIEHRHSAMGDCLAAAQAWARLIPLLRDRDIRTLGEILALAGQRQDLILRQTEAGWFSIPGELVNTSPPPPMPRIDSYVFEKRLRDLMNSPPVMVSQHISVRVAAQTMLKEHVGALLIGEPDSPPLGIVTEKDLLRAVAQADTDPDNTPVSDIMNSPVESMPAQEMLYRALARMDRLGVRHLCVTDEAGIAVGMVSQRDLLQHRARGPDMLSDALEAAQDTTTLAAAFAQVPSVATRLVREDLDGVDVARVISTELQALTARATQLCMAQMEANGDGPAPADWCVLVLGSGGRGESLLSADQDNALIHAGSADDDAWFARFGALLEDMLDAAGLPRCNGNVMVSAAQWRGTVSEWHRRVDDWLRRARPADILNVDIFFDLVPVAGNTELARRLHRQATQVASKSLPFIGLLAQSVQSLAPRFSLFGRVTQEDGRINLKRDGLLPLVSLARTLGLRIGSESRATPERLRDACAAGRLAEGDAQRLIELHSKLLTHILHQQLADLEQGVPPSSNVEIRQLQRKQYSALQADLKHLDTMVGEIRSLIAG